MLTLEQQIFKQIEKANNILLSFPAEWDGDAVAAASSFFVYLKKIGKNVDLAGAKSMREVKQLSFLPGFSDIKNSLDHLRRFIVSLDISKTKVSQIKYLVENNQLNFIVSPENGWFEASDVSTKAGEFKYDLIFVIGANDLESLGNLYDQNVEFFYKTPIINISQQAANEEFGQINLINLNCVAVSELVFNLIQAESASLIDEDIATGLLAGIIMKTRNFKTGNLTPQTLMVTSELISAGARREEIINRLYRSHKISDLKLWGKVLNNLKLENNGTLAWSWLTKDDTNTLRADGESLRDMVDELMSNLPDTKIFMILMEKDPTSTEIFAFSLKNINMLDIFKEYSPAGTVKSASLIIKKDLKTVTLEQISEINKKLDKLK
jgi:nanoRNase/pAp phosphatase (c-di-AMP/oligoRNAs hydrolase)